MLRLCLPVSDAQQTGTEPREHLQTKIALHAAPCSQPICMKLFAAGAMTVPTAVTDSVAHQGKPVTVCNPSMTLTAAPIGPSRAGVAICAIVSASPGASDQCSCRSTGEPAGSASAELLVHSGRVLAERKAQREKTGTPERCLQCQLTPVLSDR